MVIIADSPAEIPSIYTELSSVFSVLGYKVGTYHDPRDVEQSNADLMVVGVSRRRPKQMVKLGQIFYGTCLAQMPKHYW